MFESEHNIVLEIEKKEQVIGQNTGIELEVREKAGMKLAEERTKDYSKKRDSYL
jgi:hypothetical protein